jgi:hypothetical protein
MEKVFKVFKTHAEAEKADDEYYASLSPQEGLNLCLELSRRLYDDPPQRLQRIYTVTKLKES